MMRRLILALSLLAAFAVPSSAQSYGVSSLAWSDCGAAGVSARTFACNTNTGSEQLVVSFRPPAGVTDAFEYDADLIVGVIDFTTVPDWWNFLTPSGCRRTSVTVSANLSFPSGACEDPWTGLAFALVSASPLITTGGGAMVRERLHVTVALPNASPVPLDPATDYYGLRMSISHAKTTGTGACTGCSQPMCITLGSTSLLTNPANPQQLVFSQTPIHSVSWNGGQTCDRLVAVKNRTWGALKTLYR